MLFYVFNPIFPVLPLAANNSILKKTYFKVGLTLLIVLKEVNNLLITNQIIST
jgi:hypothetical protein